MDNESENNVISIRTRKPLGAYINCEVIPDEVPQKRKSNKGKKSLLPSYEWEFKPRFRRSAFGWKSHPAITRIKQAVTEIKKVAKKDPVIAAEGAVILLERLSSAIEQVDGSSGSIGSAVNNAIRELVPLIADADADPAVRNNWLERLWDAIDQDDIPYIENLGDHWGELCASKELASKWADEMMNAVRLAFSERGGFFKGSSACLSALVFAERFDDLWQLLEAERHKMWHYQQFGSMALVKQGKISEAIEFAEGCGGLNDGLSVASTCEQLLLEAGRYEEAYERYAHVVNGENSYLATYRRIPRSIRQLGLREYWMI
ncbi:MAG: hypothetical protein K2X77_32695 [Candidatus Obscuribacterales bacterium]|jgi:tetratricopeptide (TPR) repeat protein|nr:hypothetical protein [Candidatus Obscuribacterales bacterium]